MTNSATLSLPEGLCIIYARSLNFCIGKDGGLPWSLPEEYAHFEKTTLGYPIIMGRRSYEDHNGAIPGCLNIVVTRNHNLNVPDEILLAEDLKSAIKVAAKTNNSYFVIGGAGLITEALPQAKVVFETIVNTQIEGDTFLPAIDFSDWTTQTLAGRTVDNRHAFEFKAYRHTRR